MLRAFGGTGDGDKDGDEDEEEEEKEDDDDDDDDDDGEVDEQSSSSSESTEEGRCRYHGWALILSLLRGPLHSSPRCSHMRVKTIFQPAGWTKRVIIQNDADDQENGVCQSMDLVYVYSQSGCPAGGFWMPLLASKEHLDRVCKLMEGERPWSRRRTCSGGRCAGSINRD
jgi:hypothetical protein